VITYKKGNLLDAPVEALVNTVNTMGVMGKGIALQMRDAFPENTKAYVRATKEEKLKAGSILVVPVNSLTNVRFIINFATKANWRFPSRLSWIDSGLKELREWIESSGVRSIAVPPLGCGQGGLNWEDVRQLIEGHLGDLSLEILVYEPSPEVKAVLMKQEKPSAAKLTEPRAMLLSLLYQYRLMGENITEFAAEKLSYFLQRAGETQLKLEFKHGVYGPYSGKVRHVLYALNGYYIKGFEQKDMKPFEPLQLVHERRTEVETFVQKILSPTEQKRLNKVAELIAGFETPFGMELLASVDMIRHNQGINDPQQIYQALWTARKQEMFSLQHIKIAIEKLNGAELVQQ
jgi:O-acetyl-ADP-ribose deacetylase (regulator of RNase III)